MREASTMAEAVAEVVGGIATVNGEIERGRLRRLANAGEVVLLWRGPRPAIFSDGSTFEEEILAWSQLARRYITAGQPRLAAECARIATHSAFSL